MPSLQDNAQCPNCKKMDTYFWRDHLIDPNLQVWVCLACNKKFEVKCR